MIWVISCIITNMTMMMMKILFREGQLVTSVVLERNGLPVMPTNRVIPVIQVTIIVDDDISFDDDCDDDYDDEVDDEFDDDVDDVADQEEHSSPLATSPLLPIPSPGSLTVTIITTITITTTIITTITITTSINITIIITITGAPPPSSPQKLPSPHSSVITIIVIITVINFVVISTIF